MGPLDKSHRAEKGAVFREREADIDPQPVAAQLACGGLRLLHEGSPDPHAAHRRIDGESADIDEIRLTLDCDTANDAPGQFGHEQCPAGNHRGDPIRSLRQGTRFRIQSSAILRKGPMNERDDRLGLLDTRGMDQYGVALDCMFPHLAVPRFQEAILSTSATADQRRRLLGLGVTLLAALFISLNTTFARIAYDSGSNPATQVLLRSLCMMLVLGGLQFVLDRGLMLPRRTIATTLALGLCILVMSVGYLSSVAYINVSLAVLVLYTYPLMVGIASPLLGRERINWLKALCIVGAFVGLVVASSDRFGTLDWRGVAFGLAGATGVAAIALFGGRAMAKAHPFTMNAWMNLWVVLAVGLYLVATGGPHFPQTSAGWLATLAVCISYMLGILFMFLGLMLVSPAQSALTMNLEPLFSTLAAILLLGETVAARQWIGMAMLLIFLCVSTLTGMSRRGNA